MDDDRWHETEHGTIVRRYFHAARLAEGFWGELRSPDRPEGLSLQEHQEGVTPAEKKQGN